MKCYLLIEYWESVGPEWNGKIDNGDIIHDVYGSLEECYKAAHDIIRSYEHLDECTKVIAEPMIILNKLSPIAKRYSQGKIAGCNIVSSLPWLYSNTNHEFIVREYEIKDKNNEQV